jgi:hypothetical protein
MSSDFLRGFCGARLTPCPIHKRTNYDDKISYHGQTASSSKDLQFFIIDFGMFSFS